MFKVVDTNGIIHDAYGTFVDRDGDVQFILCNICGDFYKTNDYPGTYRLYKE